MINLSSLDMTGKNIPVQTGYKSVKDGHFCNSMEFRLPGMANSCHKLLGCPDIHSPNFHVRQHLGHGGVKSVCNTVSHMVI